MKSRTFPNWITALSFLLIISPAYAQSSMDFEGQWVGYLKVNGIITYNISFVTTEVASKKISGLLVYMSYPVVNKISVAPLAALPVVASTSLPGVQTRLRPGFRAGSV